MNFKESFFIHTTRTFSFVDDESRELEWLWKFLWEYSKLVFQESSSSYSSFELVWAIQINETFTMRWCFLTSQLQTVIPSVTFCFASITHIHKIMIFNIHSFCSFILSGLNCCGFDKHSSKINIVTFLWK